MSDITIRKITGEEFLKTLYPKTNYAFQASPPLTDEDQWRKRVSEFEGVTSFAAFEGE
ncbi:MAG: hypothetical protein GWN30_32825, partial [Gammaproteobacteria bacterium]|nr:hypothetical protein [Gammaproteobacteria bacterium]